jgi:hypothetical protein
VIFLLSWQRLSSEEKIFKRLSKEGEASRGENHPFSWRSNQEQAENGVLQVNPLSN